LLQPLFDKSKKIESISWTQYTPYFNDGDLCTFRTNVDYVDVNGVDVDELDWYSWRTKYPDDLEKLATEGKVIDWDEVKILGEFKEVLSDIPEEFYEELFGDHVRITVSKNGTIDIEEYDHD